MRKNKIQKLSIVALTGLVAVSAYAWLNNAEIQTGTNYIKPGTISIIFDNEANAITLNGSEAIPATNQYALDTYIPYTFKVKNDGDIDAKYSIRLVTEDGYTMNPSLVEVVLNPNSYTDEQGIHYVDDMYQHPWVKLSDVNLINGVTLLSGQETDNVLFARIIESATKADTDGKSISFHLELDAEQKKELQFSTRFLSGYRLRIASEDFKDASESDFTSLKVNGEEFVGRDINTKAGFMFNWVRGEIGSDTSVPPVDGGDVVRPTAWLNGTNTFSFVFKGKEYSGTFEFDATPAYKIVTWTDESYTTLKQVKYSMDDVELEVLQDGDISTAVTKRTEVWNADGSYRFSSATENL